MTCGVLLVFALLLLPATKAVAQSGRNNRAPQPSASPRQPATQQQRQRRAASSSSTVTAPAKQTTTTSVPVLNMPSEAPPPWPTPTPTPAPSPASTNGAETQEGEEVDAADVVRISSNLVTVPASVVDEQGHAVVDLKLEDFELRVDGQPKEISDLGRSETPVRLVILFDNSMSLSSAREFEKKAAVKFFRTVMRPIDQAAIYSIWTVPIFVQPFTSDVRTLVRTIEHFGDPEDGATALFDTVAQAADYLRPNQGRKVIVIVSDGADTLSNMDFLASLKRVMTADVQVYAVQTGQLEGANLYNLSAHHRLQEYASQTGGAVYVPRGTVDLDSAFAQISADLSQQYILSYYPQDARNDGQFRTISLRVKTRPNTRVRARKGYYDRTGQKQALTPAEDTNVTISQTEKAQPEQTTNTASQPVIPISIGRSELTPARPAAQSSSRRTGGNAVGPPGPDDDIERVERTERAGSNIPTEAPASAAGTTAAPPATATATPKQTPAPTPSPTQKPAPDTNAQTATQPPAPKKPLTGGVLNGKALDLPKPVYPPAAKSIGVGGTVIVEVLIDESGKVISAHAVSGPALLQSTAVQAARLAKFSPTKLSGQPVQVIGTITYSFVRP